MGERAEKCVSHTSGFFTKKNIPAIKLMPSFFLFMMPFSVAELVVHNPCHPGTKLLIVFDIVRVGTGRVCWFGLLFMSYSIRNLNIFCSLSNCDSTERINTPASGFKVINLLGTTLDCCKHAPKVIDDIDNYIRIGFGKRLLTAVFCVML